jgi:uncharacterized protein
MTASARSSAPSRGRGPDLRSPLVLDTRELGRRPGSMRRVQRGFDAPAGWQLGIVGVPEGAPVELDLRLESVMDGVLVTGTVSAPLTAECGRCLEPVSDEVVVDVQELFAYEQPEDDPEAPTVEGDLLDLDELVRDAVVLALPANPLCADDCAGLCAGCGGKLADLAPDHVHDTLDPRWDALRPVTSTQTSTPPASTTQTES